MIKVIPDFIKNSEEIVNICNILYSSFKPREGEDNHAGFIPNLKSHFCTLKNIDMPPALLNAIFHSENLWTEEDKSFWEFIQIQRYLPGDYIVPHRDSYRVRKLHLVTLTDSICDGLVCEDNDILSFIPDKAGQYIDFPYNAAHYVSPVRDLRYSLVIGM